MSRIFVVGDIHGELRALETLLGKLEREARLRADDTLVFLGDYLDRGPDSLGVIRRVHGLATSRPGTIVLPGNHEVWAIDAWGRRGFGSPAGGDSAESARLNAEGLGVDALVHAPDAAELIHWLKGLPHFCRLPGYFISHAPVYRHPAITDTARLFEVRCFEDAVQGGYDFLNSTESFAAEELLHEEGMLGVCGHLALERVVYHKGQYLCVDTGSGLGGSLSAVVFPDRKIYSVATPR